MMTLDGCDGPLVSMFIAGSLNSEDTTCKEDSNVNCLLTRSSIFSERSLSYFDKQV